MKKALLLVVFGMMLSVVGCTDETPKTPELVRSNEDKAVTNLDSVDSIRLNLDGKEVVFPDDFTYSRLSSEGMKASGYDGTFIPTVDEDGILDIQYSDKLHVKYSPDNYIISNIDSMYLTGFTYSGESVEILSDLSAFEKGDYIDGTSELLIGEDYTIRTMMHDEKVTGISVVCNQADNYFRLEQEYEVADDILEVDVTDMDLYDNGSIRCNVDGETVQFPEDISNLSGITCTVRNNYAFTNTKPVYIAKKVLTNVNFCGIIIETENSGVSFAKVGDAVYEVMEELGFSEGSEYRIIKLVNTDVDFDIYFENTGNIISKILIVERENDEIID